MARSICEEYGFDVESSTRVYDSDIKNFRNFIDILKVTVDKRFFTELFVRMRDVGFCCYKTEDRFVNGKTLARVSFENATKDPDECHIDGY